jgi:hypothetical protein
MNADGLPDNQTWVNNSREPDSLELFDQKQGDLGLFPSMCVS